MYVILRLVALVSFLVMSGYATTQPKMLTSSPTPAALPIGNGRIGALVYGGLNERIVLNDSSLWTGDTNPSGDYDKMGSYQMLGELQLRTTFLDHQI